MNSSKNRKQYMTSRTDEKIENKTFLRLVVDGSRHVDMQIATSEQNLPTTQLEMFKRPDALLFMETQGLDFAQIEHLLTTHHIRHILDLREVPYLNFGRADRQGFFKILRNWAVDYLSLFSVATYQRKSSVKDLLEGEGEHAELVNNLRKWIEQGPTLVLTQQEREQDCAAKNLSELLRKADIHFSELAH